MYLTAKLVLGVTFDESVWDKEIYPKLISIFKTEDDDYENGDEEDDDNVYFFFSEEYDLIWNQGYYENGKTIGFHIKSVSTSGSFQFTKEELNMVSIDKTILNILNVKVEDLTYCVILSNVH